MVMAYITQRRLQQVEFKTEDDQADAEKAVNAYNTLKDWGMQILMGTVTSGSCTAVASETDSDHMFQITPSGTAVESVEDHDNVFRLCFSDPEQGTKSAEYIAKNKLATKIAVIYNSSDVYSNGIYTNFAAEAKKEGLDVVAAEAFTADNKTDFSVQLKKAQEVYIVQSRFDTVTYRELTSQNYFEDYEHKNQNTC